MGNLNVNLSKTAQRTVHLIISYIFLSVTILQRYKIFTSYRKRPSTVNINIVGAASAASYSTQGSKFSFFVFVHVEKQRLGDANFSGAEIILIGQFFTVGSRGCKL